MSNPLAGWKILPIGELREMNRISMRENRELEKRVKMAKHEYYEFYKSCTNEVQRRKELERVSIKYNISEDVILEYVDLQNRLNRK
jgi:hypothetical protein